MTQVHTVDRLDLELYADRLARHADRLADIGSLLSWKGKPESFDSLACEPLHGFQGNANPVHIVLDGQQRLTAIYYALLAPDIPAPSRANRFLYFIRVDRFAAAAGRQASRRRQRPVREPPFPTRGLLHV